MKRRPLIMRGFRKEQQRRLATVGERRWSTPLRYARQLAEDSAKRIEASRKIFGRKFFRGDCHAHTQHSDGIGTVAEMAKMAQAAGLDFQFITDHWGVTQARECKRHGLWVGQEPTAGGHHLGILGLDHAFTPTQDLAADVCEARRLGSTVFIPHPAGWYPRTVYTEERKQQLHDVTDPLIIEVLNGANNLVTSYDFTDALAVDLWDELLMTGRKVAAMGNTDAHAPHGIGIVWNGVLAPRCEQAAVLAALTAGRSFASEGPLLDLHAGRTGMGSRVRDRSKARTLHLRAVDSRGLLQVRLIADGQTRDVWHPNGEVEFDHRRRLVASWRRYVRIEATATDGHRAFSNPIYL